MSDDDKDNPDDIKTFVPGRILIPIIWENWNNI